MNLKTISSILTGLSMILTLVSNVVDGKVHEEERRYDKESLKKELLSEIKEA